MGPRRPGHAAMPRQLAGSGSCLPAALLFGHLLHRALADAWTSDDDPQSQDVCKVTWEDADPHASLNQGSNLTEKLWIDCSCFAVGVVVATWKLLRAIFLPLWERGCRACLRGCYERCCSCCRRVRNCVVRVCWRQKASEAFIPKPNLRCCGRWRVSDVTEGRPLAFTNYFRYLGTCCVTFLVLFLVSQGLDQLFHVYEGIPNEVDTEDEDVVAYHLLRPGSIFGHLNEDNMDTVFGWVLSVVYINGLVFLAATYLLERWCDQPAVDEKVSRAIWVHGLPVKDQRLNPFVRERFRLTFDELKQVERELGARFNDELKLRTDSLLMTKDTTTLRSLRTEARFSRRVSVTRARSMSLDSVRSLSGIADFDEDEGEWVVDDWDAHLPHHSRREPSDGLSVGNNVGAKGIFRDAEGRAVFVRKVLAASRIENVWVVPAVRSWIEASERLEETFKEMSTYRLWALAYQLPSRNSVWDKAWRRWYQFRSEAVEKRVGKLEAELLRVRLKKLRMCGSAFVLFSKVEDCRSLLGRSPKWWHCQRWMCWFNMLKFGHVPFTSVTLEYEPAPHPDDINWENMDTPRWWSESVFLLLTLVLVLFMLAGQAVIMWILGLGRFGYKVSQHFASLMLLFINRSVLPFPVEWIALAGKFRRKTEGELRQMHLNFWLLIVNTIVVPLLGLQIAQQIPPELKKNPLVFLWCVSFKLLNLPKRLFVGYLFDVTFLTNLYQVLAGSLFQLCWWLQRKLTATLPPDTSVLPPDVMRRLAARLQKSESRHAMAAPQYGFGYYYAWTLSIVALALLASAEVPCTLLIAALCFCVKVIVDWANLANKVYEIGPEHEGVLITWAVFYMRLCVSGWWFMTGLGIQQLCADFSHDCPGWVWPASFGMISLACVVFVVSFFRTSYVIAIRRFFPGKTKQEGGSFNISTVRDEKLSWDAAPQILRFEESNGALEASSPTAGSRMRWRWAFNSVEQVVEEVEERPFLEEFVQRFLDSGQSVPEILLRLQKGQYRKSVSCPAGGAVP